MIEGLKNPNKRSLKMPLCAVWSGPHL